MPEEWDGNPDTYPGDHIHGIESFTEPEPHPLAAVRERNAAIVIDKPASELGKDAAIGAIAKIRGAIMMAREFPRDEQVAQGKLLSMCERDPVFADKAVYRFTKGDTVEGVSIRGAEAFVSCWTNMHFGQNTVHDDDQKRTVRGWCWDLELNIYKEADLTFTKKIYRKKTGWRIPDDREMLELSNLQSSKAVRNCIVAQMPYDLRGRMIAVCNVTVNKQIEYDPRHFLQETIASFETLGISNEELAAFVGQSLEQLLGNQEAQRYLRQVANGISEGASWRSVIQDVAKKKGVEGKPQTATELRDLLDRANHIKPS